MEKKKICLVASSGGHYEELLMLKPLLEQYEGFVLTEKTRYTSEVSGVRTYYVPQVNRKEWSCWPRLIANSFISLWIFLREVPDVVISTGALAVIPMCLLVKIFGGKLIFIESIAKITSPTKTGRFLYRYSDKFYVQWESMKAFYLKAECLGRIY